MSLLHLNKLTMRFGGLTAVDSVDCAVEKGNIQSIIGPNGAGKTTVFNAITGIYEPTVGEIRFEGKDLRRPRSARLYAGCIAVGLITGLFAALCVLGVDSLWKAAVKRNYTSRDQEFTLGKAIESLKEYWRGDLALQKRVGNRWNVVSADGSLSFGTAKTREEAMALREKLIAEQAAGTNERLRSLADEAANRRLMAWLGLLLGSAVGAAGTYAVWSRARRTPDVIALAGIARTFQNIRLFKNMTVLENVLTAMDRQFRTGAIRLAVRSPASRREEHEAERKAAALLDFVGLKTVANDLARNLPYGDQRRLEIARAMATEPRLILLDEPAAGMNPSESADLTRLIQRIRERGITVLLIEHHMKLVMGISDRIAVLDYGKKIAEGTPEEVRANPAVIKAYLGEEEVG